MLYSVSRGVPPSVRPIVADIDRPLENRWGWPGDRLSSFAMTRATATATATSIATVNLATLVALLLGACGDGGASAADDACSGPEDHSPACIACRGDEDPVVGIEREGERGVFALELLASAPTPHIASLNTMTVRLADSAGGPVDGAVFTRIEPHTRNPEGHGTSLRPEARPGESAGEYILENVNYVHSGSWTVTMDIEAGGEQDTIGFLFCIDETPAALAP